MGTICVRSRSSTSLQLSLLQQQTTMKSSSIKLFSARIRPYRCSRALPSPKSPPLHPLAVKGGLTDGQTTAPPRRGCLFRHSRPAFYTRFGLIITQTAGLFKCSQCLLKGQTMMTSRFFKAHKDNSLQNYQDTFWNMESLVHSCVSLVDIKAYLWKK